VEQILIRNLPEGTKAILRRRAAAHNSSIEAEAREALAVGIAAEEPTLVDLISMSTDAHVEFEPKRLGLKARRAEL
jgi:plasmid stability protein